MEQTPQTAQPETVASSPLLDENSAGSRAGNPPPSWITTREAAVLLGKSPSNVRARASKGDFGPTQAGPDGLPRYDRERVRAVGERMAARQARGLSAGPALNLSTQTPSVTALLDVVQAQRVEQSALCQAWVEEARETARLAKAEVQELRALLLQREETTRETLSHMDMLHDQNIQQAQEAWARERAQWEREVATKDAELERLRTSVPADRNRVSFWGKPAKES